MSYRLTKISKTWMSGILSKTSIFWQN